MSNPNPVRRGQQRDKPFRDALRMELASAGEDLRALRKVARALIKQASKGAVPAVKEIADRMDGKVPQAIVGDEEHPSVFEEATDEQRAKALAILLAKVGQK